MYKSDLKYLCCPKTQEDLRFRNIAVTDDDGEVIDGTLESAESGETYLVTNGIPRFVTSVEYNKSWDYKWVELDGGRGLNYRITDKADPAYHLHDLFDKNSHGGSAHAVASGKIALDVGCGVGQYSFRILREFKPKKMISMDLTRGTDVFRKIMLERFPNHKRSLLIVQATIFYPPFRPGSIDYVMSLGVLMHTGDTKLAITQAAKLVANGGHLNIWLYASTPVAYDFREPGRGKVTTIFSFLPEQVRQMVVFGWVKLINAVPHRIAVAIMTMFAADVFYKSTKIPYFGKIVEFLFPRVRHPDRAYRLINIYDWFRNNWGDTWSEHEIFPVLRDCDIAVLALSEWRLGFFGRKRESFYAN